VVQVVRVGDSPKCSFNFGLLSRLGDEDKSASNVFSLSLS